MPQTVSKCIKSSVTKSINYCLNITQSNVNTWKIPQVIPWHKKYATILLKLRKYATNNKQKHKG